MADSTNPTRKPPRMQRVIVIGGGAIGSAIAYFLTRQSGRFAVTVIERDPTYRQASSALSASAIRQQFSTAINIEMSRYGFEFLRTVSQTLRAGDQAPDIGLSESGYLYLATPAGVAVLRENHALQKAHGVDVVLLTPAELRARFPWISTGELALASLGLSGEGWFDGYSLLQALRVKAVAQGARYMQAQASGLRRDGRSISAVRLSGGETLPCDAVVNAAGPWAAGVAAWADIELPVRARRRTVFSFSCPQTLRSCPLVVDTSGIWFRPEGRQFIGGFAPSEAEDLDDLPLEAQTGAFDTLFRPALAERVAAFEAIRMTGAWAGYYEMNLFDHNAIIGLHPDCANLYFANGFSGHGLQQCPATGRGIAELIEFGEFRSLDLSAVSFQRVVENRPLLEKNVI
jgi:FAD-dependent oxidoreductase domain-containing protein 1